MAEEGIAAGGVMDANPALPEVLNTALGHHGLPRDIRKATKALDKRQAHPCVLASNCDEPRYARLVEALGAKHEVNLIKAKERKKETREWVGLCKIDREGKPRKVVGCSCVVVKVYGKESQAKDVIEEYCTCKKQIKTLEDGRHPDKRAWSPKFCPRNLHPSTFRNPNQSRTNCAE
ncbi:40S ribosomal protein S12-like [Sorex fumeus]|uniref:40S ribosomal protein S12-like n=1 Tax=Sorex fumeus TaxID=62283 RepID=UPI0024AD43B2|nr:40S ribosomal protein S12-like [Sorex fumeus]